MSRRPLRIESLERRMLMAGDVSVVVRSGDLVITGDANVLGVGADESIRIEHDGTNYSVTGLSGTTINGASSPFQSAAVTRDIIVDLKTGDDIVEILGSSINNRLVVPRNLTIRGGTGVDTIRVENVEVVGVLNVDGGAGANTIDVKGSRLTRDAVLRGGADADTITIDQSQFLGKLTVDALAAVGGENKINIKGNTSVTRDALIRGGIDPDKISIIDTSFVGKLTVDALAGVNSIDVTGSSVGAALAARDTLIRGGASDDTISIQDSSFSGKLTVDALTGTNEIEVLGTSSIGRDALIRGGALNDAITVDGASFGGKLTIDALAGMNSIDVRNVNRVALDALIRGGANNDAICIVDVDFRARLTVDTFAGDDSVKIGDDDSTEDEEQVGVVRDVLVRSTGGNNDFAIDRLTAGAKLTVTTGGGVDKVRILSSSITGALGISTGSEADDIGLNSVNVTSNITINAGLNLGKFIPVIDPVTGKQKIENGSPVEEFIGDPDRVGIVGGEAVNVSVDMGDSGRDTTSGIGEVGITGTEINGNLTIKTGNNADLIGVGNDSDLIEEMKELIELVEVADKVLSVGASGPVSVGNTVSIVSGMGFDRIRVHTVSAKVFKLDTGLGWDTVRINALSVAPNTLKSQLSIKMGDGDDRLTLTNTDVSSFTSQLVDGGMGSDTLITKIENEDTTGPVITTIDTVFKNWEVFNPNED